MSFTNEAPWDRIVRTMAGVPLVIIGWFVAGMGGVALAAAGIVLVATAAIGWCPIYQLFHINTRPLATP